MPDISDIEKYLESSGLTDCYKEAIREFCKRLPYQDRQRLVEDFAHRSDEMAFFLFGACLADQSLYPLKEFPIKHGDA